MPEPHDELTELLSALLDQQLGEQHRRRLAAMLQASAIARRQYLDMLELSALMSYELAAPLEPAAPVRPAASGRRSRTAWLLTLAAALLIGVTLAAWRLWPAPEVVARVTMIGSDERFKLPTSQVPGENLLAGETLSLASGLVQVEFASGARIVLQGQGELVLKHGNGCRLLSGNLAADVPPSAVGFTVETSAGVVRDLGTRFQLSQLPEQTWRLSVAQGAVELIPADLASPTASGTRLTTGKAVQFGGPDGVTPVDFAVTAWESAKAPLDKIDRYEGPLVLLTTPPQTVQAQFFAAAKSAILLVERQGVVLTEELSVDLGPSGGSSLAADKRLDSFLIHLDVANDLVHNQAEEQTVSGSITFRQAIAGVLWQSETLLAADATFGLPETAYPSQGAALEQRGANEPNDQIELVDQHTIRFRLSVEETETGRGIDQFRVLTIAQP